MDRSDKQPQKSEYQQELEQSASIDQSMLENQYITDERGNKFRVPYRKVRQVVFSKISKESYPDQEHAARLQYRLMLKDAILKARVNYIKGIITVIYNPKDADNLKEKMSLDEIIEFLSTEGVHVDRQNMADEEYDYYKNFYSYAFNSPSVREHAPYGYTLEEWRKMKPEWERKKAEYKLKSEEKQKAFQEDYLRQHPELAQELGVEVPQAKKKLTLVQRIFGR